MKELLTWLVLLSLIHPVVNWGFHIKNQRNLETKYSDYCGTQSLCSDENSPQTNLSMDCPQCICTDDCEILGRCCPDKSLSKCARPVYSIDGHVSEFSNTEKYWIVSLCPQPEMDCSMSLENASLNFQRLAPVDSIRTNITYLNSKCAKCHGENDFIEWSHFLQCKMELNLNIYSYADELLEDMKRYDCFIHYYPSQWNSPRPCERSNLITECNHTGNWDIYDQDMETACKNHLDPYKHFQNVFCFLCNTGVNQRNTFKIQYDIARGQNSSKQASFYQYTNDTMGDVVSFEDTRVLLNDTYDIKDKIYKAFLTLLSWDVMVNVNNILLAKDFRNESYLVSYGDKVNLTALYEEYIRSGGYSNWCQADFQANRIYSGFKSRRTCSCDQNCYQSRSCCPDVAYYQSKACKVPMLAENSNGNTIGTESVYPIFLISRCPVNYNDTYVKTMCENVEENKLLNIPVINVNTSEAYINHYCYLCHNQYNLQKDGDNKHTKAFNITLTCPTLLYPRFLTTMESLFNLAKQSQCSVIFTTDHSTETCYLDSINTNINKCNVSGVMKSVSTHARKLCEDPNIDVMAKSSNHLYKNQICDLCNSEVYEDPVGVCLVDQNFTYIDPVLCEQGDLETEYYPFKNYYCEKCGSKPGSINPWPSDPPIYDPTYRQLFSVLDTPTNKIYFKTENCKENEVFDVYKSECRKLYCSKGKFVKNSTCVHFIPFVKSVAYRMAFKVSLVTNVTDAYSALQNLQMLFQHDFQDLNVYPEFVEFYAFVNTPCSVLQMEPQNEEEATVYLKLTMTQFSLLNKTAIEEKLLRFKRLTVDYDGVFYTFQESVEAWYFPVLYLSDEQTLESEGCLIKDTRYYDTKLFFDVNELLLCTQIELEPDEFEFSEGMTRIYVPTVDIFFNVNEFHTAHNGTIRICSESYRRIAKPQATSVIKRALIVVTYISTILSLLALTLTFITFCILPSLRTLPGKNMMCYTLSLFFAQLLFLVRSHSELFDSSACAIMGGLTHYFWLSVFTCTNICCFHMFRLFVFSSLIHDDTNNVRQFLKNVFIAFFTPVIPVGINVILSYTVKGTRFGYGGSVCFLPSSTALFFIVILPVTLQILFNLLMFSITFHFIRKTPKVESSKDRNEFSIFLKLFLLTGVSWILLVVDGFFEISLFTFLATIINGSQGVFLFISYVCNEKVLRALKQKIVGKSEKTNLSFTGNTSLISRSGGTSFNSQQHRSDTTRTSKI